MELTDNYHKFIELRSTYPCFTYEDFKVQDSGTAISIRYTFKVGEQFVFHPELLLQHESLNASLLSDISCSSFLFHIGMVEMMSYWKAFCCPEIIIKPYKLSIDQQEWWKKLWLHGMGEFLYTNNIPFDFKGLCRFSFPEDAPSLPKPIENDQMEDSVLIPIGGGKDSVVTVEMLRQSPMKTLAFVLNRREATDRVISLAEFNDDNVILIQRIIDPLLLQLNQRGYLNGHTPFSALLAFVTALTAYVKNIRYIALSNESSANEPSIPGTNINHQYSKSIDFEKDFRYYLHTYMHKGISYFSFLRPLNELQIAAFFARYNQYHRAFRSCNAGSKNDSWCGKCPKCLFTFIILAPFMGLEETSNIFGKNLLEHTELNRLLEQLAGYAANKPFECVGTTDEVRAALSRLKDKLEDQNTDIPHLLILFQNMNRSDIVSLTTFDRLMNTFNRDHFLDTPFMDILRENLNKLSLKMQ